MLRYLSTVLTTLGRTRPHITHSAWALPRGRRTEPSPLMSCRQARKARQMAELAGVDAMPLDNLLRSIARLIRDAVRHGRTFVVWQFPVTVTCSTVQRITLVHRLQAVLEAKGYRTQASRGANALRVYWGDHGVRFQERRAEPAAPESPRP